MNLIKLSVIASLLLLPVSAFASSHNRGHDVPPPSYNPDSTLTDEQLFNKYQVPKKFGIRTTLEGHFWNEAVEIWKGPKTVKTIVWCENWQPCYIKNSGIFIEVRPYQRAEAHWDDAPDHLMFSNTDYLSSDIRMMALGDVRFDRLKPDQNYRDHAVGGGRSFSFSFLRNGLTVPITYEKNNGTEGIAGKITFTALVP